MQKFLLVYLILPKDPIFLQLLSPLQAHLHLGSEAGAHADMTELVRDDIQLLPLRSVELIL